MIIVLGSVMARPDTLAALKELARAHVGRSRGEPGCLSHDVHIDMDNPMRLVFVERWADLASLQAHFAEPAARGFVREARRLAAEPEVISIYEAAPRSP